jgi:hypothetical protein
MNRYLQIGILLFVLLIVGGIVALGLWDAPPPDGMVETELDDSRFPR